MIYPGSVFTLILIPKKNLKYYQMAYIEITTVIGCRVDCDFCPQPLLMDKYSIKNNVENINYVNPVMMSFETFKICIDKIPKRLLIIFIGFAEPFLNPECIKMIIYAHNSGHLVRVFSTLANLRQLLFKICLINS